MATDCSISGIKVHSSTECQKNLPGKTNDSQVFYCSKSTLVP